MPHPELFGKSEEQALYRMIRSPPDGLSPIFSYRMFTPQWIRIVSVDEMWRNPPKSSLLVVGYVFISRTLPIYVNLHAG